MYSTHSSSSISAASISSSLTVSNEKSLSWSLIAFSVFALVHVVYVFAVFNFVFHDLFVSSFRLYDETEHIACLSVSAASLAVWIHRRFLVECTAIPSNMSIFVDRRVADSRFSDVLRHAIG